MASPCDNPILSTSRISPIILLTFKDKKMVSTFMYRTLVVSFSKLTELFGRTNRSEPTGRSISNLSLRLAPSFLANLKKQRWIWCFCLSFQFLQCNFCKSIFTLSVCVCVLFVLNERFQVLAPKSWQISCVIVIREIQISKQIQKLLEKNNKIFGLVFSIISMTNWIHFYDEFKSFLWRI